MRDSKRRELRGGDWSRGAREYDAELRLGFDEGSVLRRRIRGLRLGVEDLEDNDGREEDPKIHTQNRACGATRVVEAKGARLGRRPLQGEEQPERQG